MPSARRLEMRFRVACREFIRASVVVDSGRSGWPATESFTWPNIQRGPGGDRGLAVNVNARRQ
jgi:hypothetical protein